MAADKRFWTGAAAVVTVVIAGAGTLPSLLLTPAEPVPLVAPIAARPAEKPPQPFRATAPEPVRAEPAALVVVAPTPPPPVPVAAVPPAPAAVAAAPEPASPTPVATVISFPPVQPVGIAATASEAAPAPSRPVGAERTRPVREARASQASRKRALRPARYPIREFLAWRR